MTTESYHDPLVRLAYRYVMDGMPAGKVVETLQGLLEAVPGPHDERWQARFDDIERTVETAAAKHLRPALHIIQDWMQETLDPGHRNPDRTFYSRTDGADVALAKIYPDEAVLAALQLAVETPRDKGRVKLSQLPVVFKRHKPAAFGELLKGLPLRDPETVTLAADEVRCRSATCSTPRWMQERLRAPTVASLGSWATTFAKLRRRRMAPGRRPAALGQAHRATAC